MSIFHEIAAHRKAARQASKRWGVYRVCKNGQLTKLPIKREATQEAALNQAAGFTSLNPGSTYVVRSIA